MIQQDQREAPDQAALERMRRAFNDPDATEEFSGAASSTMGDEVREPMSRDDRDRVLVAGLDPASHRE